MRKVTSALMPMLGAGPDLLVVQGDTSSALGAALAAFTAGVPVAHVEAGLRTHDSRLPWPEEEYRTAIDLRSNLVCVQSTANPQLIILLKDAYRARALALSKPRLSLEQLATKFGRSIERYKRLLRLSYLSPTIVTAILHSHQPSHLTNRFLQNLDGLPLSWAVQEQLLLG